MTTTEGRASRSKTPPPLVAPESYRSVRTFLIWLVLACLLPGVIGASMLFLNQFQQARAQQESDTMRTVRALVQALDSHLLRGQAVGQTLSTRDSLARQDFARFHSGARGVLTLSDLGVNVALRDRSGQQILNTAVELGQPLPGSLPASIQRVFDTGKPAVSDLFVGGVFNQAMISVDVPVFIEGKLVYALSIGILPSQFNAILQAQGLPPGWIAAVIDSSGTIVGRNLAPEKFIGNKATDKLREALMSTSEGMIEATTQEGKLAHAFYSRSPSSGWTVVIGIPNSALHAARVLPLSLLALGVAALFGIGLVLARFMGARIARSVTALTAPALALGSGGAVQFPRLHVKEAAEVAQGIERAAALLAERAAALKLRDQQLMEAQRLAGFGTWFWDLRSGAVEVSDTIKEIYGREVPGFAEQRGTLLTVASWEQVDAASKRVMRSGQGYDLELEVNHGLGHSIWVNAKCEAVMDEQDKEVVMLRGTIQDITMRRAQQEALRASECQAIEAAQQAQAERKRLSAVLEATPVGIVVVNASGAVLQSNAANQQLWGSPPVAGSADEYDQWRGWWADHSSRHGQALRAQDWTMARVLRGEDAPRDIIEIAPFDAPAVRRVVLVSAAAIKDGDGRIVGGVVAQMDITDQVRAEQALRQADRRKDEFLAMLAHELRNPLAPISSAAEMLSLGALDLSRVKQVSEIISRQVRHMTGLVDDLLDVSRVTRGQVALDKQPLEVGGIVADALEQVRPLAQARQQPLRVQAPTGRAFVCGDRKRLVQVVSNLLNNAVKFTPEGGLIELEVKADEDTVTMTVSDKGIGMTPELAARAFDLFAQGERGLDRSQGGLGIGLAIVKSLVALHQGSVVAQSAGPNQGSRFTVSLPRFFAREMLSAREPAAALAAMAVTTGPVLKVLVVDDNEDAARTLAIFVEAMGHRVFVEHNALGALRRASVESPDVCLLDIGLPGMNGHELAKRLRAQPDTADAVLVAVTGYGNDRDGHAAMHASFDHYFVKPFDGAALAALLRRIGGQRATVAPAQS